MKVWQREESADALIARFRGEPGECWIWPGNPNAYPKVWLPRQRAVAGAHRYVMCVTHPDVDLARMHTLHSCDNKRCVNPAHISPGTRGRNVRDAYARGLNPRVHGIISDRALQTHCIHGHEFTDENTRITGRGTRSCIQCERNYGARRAAERKGKPRPRKTCDICGQERASATFAEHRRTHKEGDGA